MSVERDRRLQDLEKVNQLETKVQIELENLKSRKQKMTEELHHFSNIEEVRAAAEESKAVCFLNFN
jgi:intraflagellar transport protein 74